MGSRTGRERMLPLMTATVVVLGVFFFGASMWQLWALNDAIADAPGLTNAEIAPLLQDLAGASTQAEQVAAQSARWSRLPPATTPRSQPNGHSRISKQSPRVLDAVAATRAARRCRRASATTPQPSRPTDHTAIDRFWASTAVDPTALLATPSPAR